MKIYLTLILVLCFIGASSQSYYHTLSKDQFDTLDNSKYYGRLFLKDNTQLDGWVKKTPTDEIIKFKVNGDNKYQIYTPFKVEGFYLVNAQLDTAWFVFKRVKSENKEYRALRILIDGGPEGLHLLRYAWLSSSVTRWNFFNSDVYQLNWKYFLWEAKNRELIDIIFYSKQLKRAIKDSKQAFEYYKEHRKKFNRDGHYVYLSNTIRIYNIDKQKNNEKENN